MGMQPAAGEDGTEEPILTPGVEGISGRSGIIALIIILTIIGTIIWLISRFI